MVGSLLFESSLINGEPSWLDVVISMTLGVSIGSGTSPQIELSTVLGSALSSLIGTPGYSLLIDISRPCPYSTVSSIYDVFLT